MSRIGKKAIAVPAGVTVDIKANVVSVKGPKGTMSLTLPPHTAAAVENGSIIVSIADENARNAGAMHGLARSLVNNIVIGVTAGFKKELAIVGVGYKAQLSGTKLNLSLGFSHPIVFEVPKGIKMTVTPENKMTIEGCDKQLVGETAAQIRRFRPPEPYKGKGIRYVDERIILKEGKSAG